MSDNTLKSYSNVNWALTCFSLSSRLSLVFDVCQSFTEVVAQVCWIWSRTWVSLRTSGSRWGTGWSCSSSTLSRCLRWFNSGWAGSRLCRLLTRRWRRWRDQRRSRTQTQGSESCACWLIRPWNPRRTWICRSRSHPCRAKSSHRKHPRRSRCLWCWWCILLYCWSCPRFSPSRGSRPSRRLQERSMHRGLQWASCSRFHLGLSLQRWWLPGRTSRQ